MKEFIKCKRYILIETNLLKILNDNEHENI